ncbi:MAG: sigma-54 factor interaction domain-containing protein [Deltaproteobacteria bacterium]|nr:MAG: sigma-54 factor interaction domain-containing protein [Deltaproteobacteria bacterium]
MTDGRSLACRDRIFPDGGVGARAPSELANHGTLLLDDVVDMPLEMQAKLLATASSSCTISEPFPGSPTRSLGVVVNSTDAAM